MAITGNDFLLTPVKNFPYVMRPLNNITPFTYENGTTYLEILTYLAKYIKNMGPDVDEKLKHLFEEFQKGITNAENTIIKEREEWKKLFDEFMANIVVQLEALNDASVSNLIENSNSETRKSLDKFTVYENVLRFGAIGDGINDDTPHMQAGVDYLASVGGGTLYFPPGTYRVDGQIVLRGGVHDNITITGTHNSLIRKLTPGVNYAVFVGMSGSNLGYGGGVKNFSMTNIVFRGDLKNGNSISALTGHRMSGIYVDNCKFLEPSQNGHVFDLLGCENIVIKNSEFRGIKPIAGRHYTEAIQLDSSSRRGFGVREDLASQELFDGTPTRNITVRNCVFGSIVVGGITYLGQSPLGSHSYIDGRPYTNILFENNDVSDIVDTTAGSYQGILHFFGAQDIRVRNNKFRAGKNKSNCIIRSLSGTSAISFSDINNPDAELSPATTPIYGKDIIFEGNEVSGYESTLPNIYIYAVANRLVENITVKDNEFTNCNTVTGNGYLMQLTFGRNIKVKNNDVNGCGKFLYSADIENFTLSENIVLNSTEYFTNMIRISPLTIKANIVKNSSGRVLLTSCNKLSLKDNDFSTTLATENYINILGSVSADNYYHITNNTFHCDGVNTGDGVYATPDTVKRGLVVGNLSRGYGRAVGVGTSFVNVNNETIN